MRLVWPENVNFRRKMSIFGGKCQFSSENGGFRRERRLKLKNQKIRLCNHKTQLISRITLTVSLKIKPETQMYANVSDPPPPYFFC